MANCEMFSFIFQKHRVLFWTNNANWIVFDLIQFNSETMFSSTDSSSLN